MPSDKPILRLEDILENIGRIERYAGHYSARRELSLHNRPSRSPDGAKRNPGRHPPHSASLHAGYVIYKCK